MNTNSINMPNSKRPAISKAERDVFKSKLEEDFNIYINTISNEIMAISLELASYLLAFCHKNKPLKILDLGTGFSSFVFRSYNQKNKSSTVISVDHSIEWMEKTISYIRQSSLSIENFYTWNRFLEIGEDNFDLILYDLGYMDFRVNNLEKALTFLGINGNMILDDVHKSYYSPLAETLAKNKNYGYFDIKECTIDHFGRYASLISRPKNHF